MKLLAAAVAAVPLALALAPAAGGAAVTKTVVVKDIDFKPRSVVVRKGTTVRWAFRDGAVAHNVVSRGRLRFKRSPTRTSGSHSVRFRRAGTYRYVCTLHPGMAGRITVR